MYVARSGGGFAVAPQVREDNELESISKMENLQSSGWRLI